MNDHTHDMLIGRRRIGRHQPAFLIAEIGMNHNGDVGLGCDMVRAAAQAGADAVKFQTFKTEHFLSAGFFDLPERKKYELDAAAHETLRDCAGECGVEFLSSPLDDHSVELLSRLGVEILKVASCDVTNIPLLRTIGATRKPVILSTGYSDYSEICRAVETLKQSGCPQLAVLHCVAVYPTPDEDAHLNNIPALQRIFPDAVVGLSDHSPDTGLIPPAAVAMGARIIEKHFTTDRKLPGYDHAMSLAPDDFAVMVSAVRRMETLLGQTRPETGSISSEGERKRKARRSLYWARDLPKGANIDASCITPKRPGLGLAPAMLDTLIGRTVSEDVKADTLVDLKQIV